jgi:hypothetical protein
MSGPREVRAPRGNQLTCKGWVQEAALRMLMNNLDPDVAERPQDLVVYGGTGKAARDWPEILKAYAKSPALFDAMAIAGGPEAELILSLVKSGRTPADAVASMDTRLVEHLAHCAAGHTAVETEKEEAVCTACGTHGARLRCSACKEMACITVLDCTRECQLADWKARHKKVCCKTRLPKANADSLKTLMAPEEVGVAAKVALLQGVMEACANVH